MTASKDDPFRLPGDGVASRAAGDMSRRKVAMARVPDPPPSLARPLWALVAVIAVGVLVQGVGLWVIIEHIRAAPPREWKDAPVVASEGVDAGVGPSRTARRVDSDGGAADGEVFPVETGSDSD